MKKLYVVLAQTLQAYHNCSKLGATDHNREWKLKHAERLGELVHEHMPSGSGIDSGTSFNLDKSTPDRLVFETSYHHMTEGGMYDGWTEHTVVVTASLCFGISIRITGRNRKDIKTYLHDVFHEALTKEVAEVGFALVR